jgi:dihydropteroate synthase
MKRLDCGGKPLDLSRPAVMGVLNVTPDSFSDGGLYLDPDAALGRALEMVEEGAAVVDVGGESTRPGADPVPVELELRRVVPVVERLARELPVPVSVDTSKPAVMKAAAQAGAGMINDVLALRAPGALKAAAEAGLPVCLMHMQGDPRGMQRNPVYRDVVAEVGAFLQARIEACEAAGIPRRRLLLDPGIGFGKTLAHNLALLRRLERLVAIGPPVLVGVSRKSMIGALLERPVGERLYGSLGAAIAAICAGATVIRAHDVGPTVDAVRVASAVLADGETTLG